MAYIGMRNPKFWPISTPRVDGSAISYGGPVEIGPAVSANVTFETNDNPDYGNDVIIDNDKGINGYSITLETNDISKDARAACLGWSPVYNTATPPAVTEYEITDAAPPEGGFSFIRVKMFRGTRSYEAFFFHALQFSDGAENASTKERQIAWNHPTMDGSGLGVFIDSSGEAKFFNWMEFASESAAEAWINSKAGYTPPASGTGT